MTNPVDDHIHSVDIELVDVIEKAIARAKSYIEALDIVTKFMKEKRNETVHFSVGLDVLCGQRAIDDSKDEAEKVAYSCLKVLLQRAKKELIEVDISNEAL